MNNISDKLKEIFQNFRWIDNIPEDQFRRDEICMQAKAALLLEANCTSERFPAFIRNAQKSYDEKCYNLPEPVILNHEFQDNSGNTITASITVNTFEMPCLDFSHTLPMLDKVTDSFLELPNCGRAGRERQ